MFVARLGDENSELKRDSATLQKQIDLLNVERSKVKKDRERKKIFKSKFLEIKPFPPVFSWLMDMFEQMMKLRK